MINRRNAMIKRKTGIAGKITKKLTITIIGGLAGVILAGTMPQQVQNFAQKGQEQTAVTAWWGTLYPKFCFSQIPEENKDQKDDIKISFWLARALDW